MASRFKLTPAFISAVSEHVESGADAASASEACGVPARVLRTWLSRGERAVRPTRCRDLWDAVQKAQAQAKVAANKALHADRPADWLKARPTPGEEDGRGGATSPLLDPELVSLFQNVLKVLEAHPEARAQLAQALGREQE